MKRLAIPVLTAALVVAMMFVQATAPRPVLAEDAGAHLAEIPGFATTLVEPSEAELTVLPKDTRIEKLRYESDDGRWFLVSLVAGGASKSSIHRPELCLPAQGFQMCAPETVAVDGVSWRTMRLEHRGVAPLGFAYTFFSQDGYRTASHAMRIVKDVYDRSVRNRIDRWSMVTVNASDASALVGFLAKLKGVIK